MALGFLLAAGQTAQASHGCPLDLDGQVVAIQHQDHLMGMTRHLPIPLPHRCVKSIASRT